MILRESAVLEEAGSSVDDEVFLTCEERRKSRYRVQAHGYDLAWFLPRGRIIRDGQVLLCEDGFRVRVRAADEAVTQVSCADVLLLTRVAYHLGNRHVSLQLGPGWLRYQSDHILDDMVAGLGALPEKVMAPFDPESGAYHTHEH